MSGKVISASLPQDKNNPCFGPGENEICSGRQTLLYCFHIISERQRLFAFLVVIRVYFEVGGSLDEFASASFPVEPQAVYIRWGVQTTEFEKLGHVLRRRLPHKIL